MDRYSQSRLRPRARDGANVLTSGRGPLMHGLLVQCHAQPGGGWFNTWNVTGDANRGPSKFAVLGSCSVM